MGRAIRIGAAGLVVGLMALAGAALGANPTKGAQYVGQFTHGLSKKVVLQVSRSGKSATATLYCAGTRAGSLPRFAITKGQFKGASHVGSTTVWSMKGHFSSSRRASAVLDLNSICDAGSGGIILLRQ
jgi:hypothetical protein